MAVPLFQITSDTEITGLVRDGIDTMIEELGRPCKIYIEGIKQQCPNCNFDQIQGRSSGIYNGTGPKPFSSPPCPVCKGTGYDPTTNYQTVIKTFSIKRNLKQQELVAAGITDIPQDVIRIKGYVSDVPPLLQMKYMIIDYLNTDFIEEKCVKLSNPSPTGSIVPGRYFIMYLKRQQ